MAQWSIDPDHSSAAFSIRHMMLASIRGLFCKIGGTISFDPLDIVNSSIALSIDASSIFTGVPKRDDHLKSQDFFDTGKYPDITFTSIRVHSVDGSKATVAGNLTMHGITRPVDVLVEFSGPIKDPFGDGFSMGFTASAVLNREEFGIIWNQPLTNNGFMVGKEVRIHIDLEADLVPE
jgi:polyisoprenoid-binding protein YceI